MTCTIEPVPDRIDQQQLAQQLVEAARADGVELIGPRRVAVRADQDRARHPRSKPRWPSTWAMSTTAES